MYSVCLPVRLTVGRVGLGCFACLLTKLEERDLSLMYKTFVESLQS